MVPSKARPTPARIWLSPSPAPSSQKANPTHTDTNLHTHVKGARATGKTTAFYVRIVYKNAIIVYAEKWLLFLVIFLYT